MDNFAMVWVAQGNYDTEDVVMASGVMLISMQGPEPEPFLAGSALIKVNSITWTPGVGINAPFLNVDEITKAIGFEVRGSGPNPYPMLVDATAKPVNTNAIYRFDGRNDNTSRFVTAVGGGGISAGVAGFLGTILNVSGDPGICQVAADAGTEIGGVEITRGVFLAQWTRIFNVLLNNAGTVIANHATIEGTVKTWRSNQVDPVPTTDISHAVCGADVLAGDSGIPNSAGFVTAHKATIVGSLIAVEASNVQAHGVTVGFDIIAETNSTIDCDNFRAQGSIRAGSAAPVSVGTITGRNGQLANSDGDTIEAYDNSTINLENLVFVGVDPAPAVTVFSALGRIIMRGACNAAFATFTNLSANGLIDLRGARIALATLVGPGPIDRDYFATGILTIPAASVALTVPINPPFPNNDYLVTLEYETSTPLQVVVPSADKDPNEFDLVNADAAPANARALVTRIAGI